MQDTASNNRRRLTYAGDARVLPGYEHVKRYWDPTRNQYAAKILPGEYYVTTENEMITTVLGSCISACVRDPVFGVGGMNHFMLPESGNSRAADSWNDSLVSASARYGNVAMEHLITDIQKFGGVRENLEVKITGGGKVLAMMTDVGKRNIQFVREYIRVEGLRLMAEDVGDIYPRKVVYIPRSGRVQVKKLRSVHNDTVFRREEQYMEQLSQKQKPAPELFGGESGGSVELF
jgi:chemotaxis protein CheD